MTELSLNLKIKLQKQNQYRKRRRNQATKSQTKMQINIFKTQSKLIMNRNFSKSKKQSWDKIKNLRLLDNKKSIALQLSLIQLAIINFKVKYTKNPKAKKRDKTQNKLINYLRLHHNLPYSQNKSKRLNLVLIAL